MKIVILDMLKKFLIALAAIAVVYFLSFIFYYIDGAFK